MGRRRSEPPRARWLGDSNSWRRVVSAGIVGGIALAILAALVSSICSGGSGSIEEERPTVAAPEEPPIDIEPPTAPDTVEPAATDVAVAEATPTDVVEPSPTFPVAEETEPPPTEEAAPTVEVTASP